MELPFYLSYEKFESRYYDDLEKWFVEHHNGSETDYLKHLAELYSPYLYYNFATDSLQAEASIQIKDCFFPYYEKIGISFCTNCENIGQAQPVKSMKHVFEWKTISMMEYAQHILDKINGYLSKNNISLKGHACILDYVNNEEIITSREGAGYCVNYNRHQATIPFLKAYLPCSGQTVDIAIYRDFILSVIQIAEYIDQKLKAVQALEHTIYHRSRSEARFRVQMSRQFLTICN